MYFSGVMTIFAAPAFQVRSWATTLGCVRAAANVKAIKKCFIGAIPGKLLAVGNSDAMIPPVAAWPTKIATWVRTPILTPLSVRIGVLTHEKGSRRDNRNSSPPLAGTARHALAIRRRRPQAA